MIRKKENPAEVPLLLRKRLPWDRPLQAVLCAVYHYGLLLIACAVLTLCTLLLTYSNFSPKILKGFFEKPLILLVNYAIVCGIALLLFGLIGRAWIAFLVTAVLCMGVAIGNYYLIIIRNDPLQFEDLSCIREALAITDAQGYELRLSGRLIWTVAACIGMTGLLALLSRWQMRIHWLRLIPLALGILVFFQVKGWIEDPNLVNDTKYYKYINTWNSTEIYVSRGILYSFTRTALSDPGKPEGYDEAQAAKLYNEYKDEPLPEDRKVDVFVIMRESYSDLSELSIAEGREGAIDFSAYDNYHHLKAESVLTGNLVTNGFGGNTKNAERCFLTGNYTLREWRKPVNSYVWYLRSQGYYAEGAHPFNGWFYNRRNINRYLGFQDYLFREDGFEELVEEEDQIADDRILFDQVWNQYQSYLQEHDGPYFNFTVTYEGHGPYHYRRNDYSTRFVKVDPNSSDGIAMNNYLSCCAKRDEELLELIDRFRKSERPIVLLTFGDHKATLGADINNYTTAAYEHYGMNLNLKDAEGFLNYYTTDYVIWMNDAALEQLHFIGETPKIGPTISPCYLMNVLFDTLGWGEGPAYLQAMDDTMETLPIFSTKGRYGTLEDLHNVPTGPAAQAYRDARFLSYYWRTNFFYQDVK